MKKELDLDIIHVQELHLWAHVGVLDSERLLGQSFLVDFSIWKDLAQASQNDELSYTVDYSVAIRGLQKLALNINCMTIEHFSEVILDYLEELYGPFPIRVILKKCSPPVNGFNGTVSVEKKRNFPSLDI